MRQREALRETVRTISDVIIWKSVPLSRHQQAQLTHIQGMDARITEDYSEAKVGRWLGWVQGVACAHGWLLLEDCKRINRKFSEKSP